MWVPCSANDELEGLPWLPRMLQKARRAEASRASGTDMMNGYLYGDNDFVDAQLLAFLRANDADVSAVVRAYDDDAEAASVIVRRSGRSPNEIRVFATSFRKRLFNFAPTEADEGRLGNGVRAKLLAFVYNRLMMPVVYRKFAADERKRAAREPTSP